MAKKSTRKSKPIPATVTYNTANTSRTEPTPAKWRVMASPTVYTLEVGERLWSLIGFALVAWVLLTLFGNAT